MISGPLLEKYGKLKELLRSYGKVAVAFSSGVDSTFLLHVAVEVLGENAFAVTAKAPIFPAREAEQAAEICDDFGVEQLACTVDVFAIEGFAQNPPNRCYLCKRVLFSRICDVAQERGAVVVDGTNLDDEGDYRPGMQALAELDVQSPLRECGFTKAEIRELSHELGLVTWNKPSCACLASRFAYGEQIDEKHLEMVDRAEQTLLDEGFDQVRVRVHGNSARIEVLEQDIARLVSDEHRKPIAQALHDIGFAYVSVDLAGYRTGSMNETL